MRLQLPVITDHDQPLRLTRPDSQRLPVEPTPPETIRWALDRFEGWRLLATTSFGMEGCVLIDMLAQFGVPLRVAYIDTGFFFEQTYQLRDRMIRRYPHLTFVNEGTDLSPEAQAAAEGPELWKTNPDRCCAIRKVEPMRRVLRTIDVWFTGLRRDQSPDRAGLQIAEWDWKFDLLKVSPLAAWSRADVWAYIQRHDVPYNPLHEQGYPTVGCTHCTRPVDGARAGQYSRDGRWNGSAKTECGLHLSTKPR